MCEHVLYCSVSKYFHLPWKFDVYNYILQLKHECDLLVSSFVLLCLNNLAFITLVT
jgi:hypothetical protein